MTRIAFVCVQNAGRSQMAAAFAERAARGRREASARASESVEIVTGGTDPADHVHDEVVAVMAERDFDLSDRTPREVTHEELQDCDYVITMGCSAKDVCPATWSGENRDWGLDDPDGQDLDAVREIRDEIERRVGELFAELDRERADER
ncbi:low molecular weight phosphatase family protein [Halorussus caseinilyticus]|uniref:Low molecular weight phosphatase family protein n=1 Tax=Halorussus caseinilyticus TaxID=3034025 RepID=A0ABD5WN29_9EURY|nr:low molecular weight phosphatase family protein [Halorussus sp. DT72]